MGRIRTQQIKRLGKQFIKLHKNELSKNFKKNNAKIEELSDVKTKKLRNMIAGFITKKMKSLED